MPRSRWWGATSARVDVTLQPQAQVLSPVRTDARAAEAEVFATRPNVATVTMGAAAMAGVPSVGEPDGVRVVQLLPGVVARNDFNTGLNVRGGEADQNLVLLDGYPIHNPFHLGGLFSTFMDATVGGIELMTGAFPARYGGRLSSVLDVRSAEDARPGVHATADVSALGATGRLAEGATLEQRVSTSGFSTRLDLGDGTLTRRNEVRDLRLGGSMVARGAAHDVSLGYEVATHRLRYAAGSPQTGTTSFDLVQRPVTAAAWVDDLWRLSPRWLVGGGLRAEALSGRDWAALSPRVSVKYFATPDVALTAAAGRATQWQHSLAGDGPLRYFDVWIASDRYIPVATAWHWIAGAERRVGGAGSVRLEGYYKRYQRVMEANWSEDPQRRGDEFLPAEARSYGLDLLARWQAGAGGVGGWVAYSYGVSSRWRGGERWAPGHDRRHDLDVVATWRVSKYRLGARFGYATGTPYTPIVGEIARRVYDPSRDSWGSGEPRILRESLGGPRGGARFPPTHRLDLDASREMRVRGATVAPYVSVVNAYNAKNVFVYLYEYSTDRPSRRAISQFPVLPSVGVRVAF